jgi:hypothetical protein
LRARLRTQAAVWPSLGKAAKANFPSTVFGRVWGLLVTSSRVGAVTGMVVVSPLVRCVGCRPPPPPPRRAPPPNRTFWLLDFLVCNACTGHDIEQRHGPARLGWQYPILAVAAMLVVIAGLLCQQTRRTPAPLPLSGAQRPAKISLVAAAKLYGRDPQLGLVIASEAMLLTVMDTSYLLPLFFNTELAVSLDQSARLASLFPLGMTLATVAAGFPFDAMAPNKRAAMLLGCGLSSSAAYSTLALTGQQAPPWVAGLLLFFAGAGFAPAKYLPSTIYVLENVEPAHSGKVLALMDVPGYIVSALFFRLYPKLAATRWGWGAVWTSIGAMVAVSTVCICCQQLRMHHQLSRAKASMVSRP